MVPKDIFRLYFLRLSINLYVPQSSILIIKDCDYKRLVFLSVCFEITQKLRVDFK